MSREAPTFMYLVRHGATASNEQHPAVLQGKGVDHVLSERGRRQAEAVGRFLATQRLDAIYSSGLKRSIETAEAIARPHGLHATPIELLHEVDVGTWEGLDWGTIQRDHAAIYAAFTNDPASQGYPGGETYAAVLARVRPLFEELFDRHAGQSFVLVGHNVVNRVYLADLLGLPIALSPTIRQSNTGINVVKRKDGETYVVTLNSAFHLSTID